MDKWSHLQKLKIHENQVSLEFWIQNPFIAIYSNLHIASKQTL